MAHGWRAKTSTSAERFKPARQRKWKEATIALPPSSRLFLPVAESVSIFPSEVSGVPLTRTSARIDLSHLPPKCSLIAMLHCFATVSQAIHRLPRDQSLEGLFNTAEALSSESS